MDLFKNQKIETLKELADGKIFIQLIKLLLAETEEDRSCFDNMNLQEVANRFEIIKAVIECRPFFELCIAFNL